MPLYLFLQNRFDFLKIYDGGNEEAPLIGNFTGSVNRNGSVLPEANINTSGGQLFMKFLTDHNNNEKGFYLSYNTIIGEGIADSCNETLIDLSGEIASPGYPNFYPHHVNCYWLIQPTVNDSMSIKYINITFYEFELEERYLL